MSNVKFGNLGSYERNDDLEAVSGIDVIFPNGITLTCLRAGGANHKYRAALRKYITPTISRRIEAGTMKQEDEDSLWAQIYAESIVIGMRGAVDPSGKKIPYSKENVAALFEAAPDMMKTTRETVEDMMSFREHEIKEEAKNLGNSSPGTSSGESSKTN
jgi:hypothetical protein